jgi:transcriptional regulator with XRE-family HTH domain
MSRREQFEAIEAWRQQAGLPISQLCRHANINESGYWRLLKRPAQVPQYGTLEKLQRATLKMGRRAA